MKNAIAKNRLNRVQMYKRKYVAICAVCPKTMGSFGILPLSRGKRGLFSFPIEGQREEMRKIIMIKVILGIFGVALH